MESTGEAVLAKAFRLLDAFAGAGNELTLAELATSSGLPRSTAHRLVGQLESAGALERTRRGWRMGVRMFELGQLVATQRGLREQALPYMNDLHEATRATIHLAVLDGADVIYVEVISGHRKVASPSRRGGRLPAHCTALGKVLLAYEDLPYPTTGPVLVARTARTIVDRAVLSKAIDDARSAAIAYDEEESQIGLRCVASPIFGLRSRVVAAMSVSLPIDGELTPQRVAPTLRIATRALSRDLSHFPSDRA